MSSPPLTYHTDGALFRDALSYTSAETGFSERLIEKDYFCSVVLNDLGSSGAGVVFKGGTCLSKVHAGFLRLSEDLDFSLAVPAPSSRKERSALVATVKQAWHGLFERNPCLDTAEPLRGFNNSTQYGGKLRYASVVSGQADPLKIEVGVREPIAEPPETLLAHTLLIDPFRGAPAVAPFPLAVLSFREAYAEKLRAALTRKEPAIRDFFDIRVAVASGRLEIGNLDLMKLVQIKLAVPGNGPIDTSPAKLALLRHQVQSQLRPVLRRDDFERFDLDLAWSDVVQAAELVSP